jgi:hypothetical protein
LNGIRRFPLLCPLPSFFPHKTPPSLFGAKFQEEDLFELVSPTGLLVSAKKWYFCPNQFPPDGNFKTSKEGWPKLKAAIVQLAPCLGYTLCTNGSSNKVTRQPTSALTG